MLGPGRELSPMITTRVWARYGVSGSTQHLCLFVFPNFSKYHDLYRAWQTTSPCELPSSPLQSSKPLLLFPLAQDGHNYQMAMGLRFLWTVPTHVIKIVFHPLNSSPSPPSLNLSQHQGLFQCVSFSHQVAKVLELQFQHQSFQ